MFKLFSTNKTGLPKSKHNIFKKKLHEALLKVMSLEDTYVDASTLISKLLQFS